MQRIRDWLTKLDILREIVWCDVEHWHKEVWSRDLDEPECCGGGNGSWDICGCGGVTIRESFGRGKPDPTTDVHKDISL